jgi:hypothetical protein
MDKNLNVIASDLFGKLRSQFSNLKLSDKESQETSEEEEARFFDFDYKHQGENLGRISINLSEKDGLVVIFSNNIVENKPEYFKNSFFNFLKELRGFAKKHLLTFDVRDITKNNLEKRDYEYLSKKQFGESKMSESKLFGTNMTSYQNLGNTRLIVKHKEPVNLENPAGRAQRIQSIYLENTEGERFKYPFRHLSGARALAQHIGHGGTPYDQIGKYIIGLSEELNKLRMFKGYVDRNEMISENMSSINSRVVERIDEIKKEIHSLQASKNYEQFAESFEEPFSKQIPENIMNDWIDRLTIRTFNEELKNVFPYIFRLIDESDLPVKDLSAEDLISENEESDIDFKSESPEMLEYERALNIVVSESELFGENSDDLILELNELISNPIPLGVDGTNAIETLSDIIDDKELNEAFKKLADLNPESDARNTIKEYIIAKDQEKGTNILDRLNFEDHDSQKQEPPPEDQTAEMPPEQPAPMLQPQTAQAQAPAIQPVMADMYSESFKKALNRARKAGATMETIINIDGKQMTLGEMIKKSKVQEDIFNNKSKELVEFVKSMFNREEGTFPKGETGVLIACEKKFGENAIPVAKRVIERLNQVTEMNKLKKMSDPSEGPVNELSSILKFAGLRQT